MNSDPRDILDQSAMTRLQVIVVGVTIALNALDGFDVMAISFASPGIAEEWNLGQGGLGLVLSMELIGMAFGSIFLGGVADKVGRRPTILSCLILMTLGMYMATTTSSLVELSLWRVVTGLGIGGMLASINAVAAEFSNAKNRHLCISMMAIGYPIGGVIGGSIATMLLASYDWRSVFYFGAIMTALLLPVFYFVVPESVYWLARKQPVGALDKINETFKRLGKSLIEALPEVTEEARKESGRQIFAPKLRRSTIILSTAYFLHIITFYFILKWVPKLVVDMGFDPSTAGGVLVWVSIGGVLGGGLFGFLTTRYDLKKLTIVVLVLAAIAVGLFGQTPADLRTMSILVCLAGFFTNAGIVGLYAIMAQVYPTHARASGTGFVVGFGRGGSVLSPIVAGFLLQGGLELPTLAILMGSGAILSAIVLSFLKFGSDLPSEGSAVKGDDTEEGMEPSMG